MLTAAYETEIPSAPGRGVGRWQWGVYLFYDYYGEPIYVGQSREGIATRVNRHLTNQRTDAVGMGLLDVLEVAELEMFPIPEFQDLGPDPVRSLALNRLEFSVHQRAIEQSRYGMILNEKLPPEVPPLDHLPPSLRLPVVTTETRGHLGHPDVRLARRAEALSRLAAMVHERGEVATGLRRAFVIASVRVARLTAERFAYAQGHEEPALDAIDMARLLGEDEPDPDL